MNKENWQLDWGNCYQCSKHFLKKRVNSKFCCIKCLYKYCDNLRKNTPERIIYRIQYYRKNRLKILAQNEASRQRHLKEDLERKRKYRLEKKYRALNCEYQI